MSYSGEHNEYTEGKWTGSRGKLHQYNIKRMFEDLEINIEDVFSTNICFIRSEGTEKYKRNLKEDCDSFWLIHEYFLSIVKPRFIIANGWQARDYFKKKIKPIYDFDKKPMKNFWKYKHIAQFFKGSLEIRNIVLDPLTVLAIPHLSNVTNSTDDYDEYYKEGVLWLKNKIYK